MELEMLKQKWNEVDSRLSTLETLNRKTVKELIHTRTRSTVDGMHRNNRWGLMCCVFIPLIVGFALKQEPVVNFWSIVLIAAGIYAYLPCLIRRLNLLSRYKVSDSTTNLMNIVLAYRKTIIIERLMIVPVSVVMAYGLIVTEHSWIIATGQLTKAILLMTVLCAIIVIAQFNDIKHNLNVLHEIEENLKEINED